MARWRALLFFILLCFGAFIAWWLVHRVSQTSTALQLTPVKFADLPFWKDSDPRPALAAFARSCTAIEKKPDSAAMGGAGYGGTVKDWREVCHLLPQRHITASSALSFFESWAQPMAISSAAGSEGIFTGYYEPEIRGSRAQHGAFQTPVYATPDNLVSVDAGAFMSDLSGRHFTGCVQGHKLLRCPERGAIDANGLPQSKVIFWAEDPIAVFFLHIQGSGRVHFDDGTMARVNYDSQNGQPYTAIGKTLIAMGVPREGMSMQLIRAWLKDHPQDARRVMETDKSFVFFREEPTGDADEGAQGSEGVALTPAASLAVDMKFHPLGVPMFVVATRPDADPKRPARPFDRLMIAQDSGGAIKGAVRGDVFWGHGPDAESIAGRMKSTGKLYVLLPKASAAHLSPQTGYATP